jgi:hypothetical protein
MSLLTRPVLSRLAVLSALLGYLLFTPVARANSDLLSFMMDDDQLVYRDDATRDRALKRMAALGVDYVRVTVLWSVVADGARATPKLDKRFRKLGADNPKAYPRLNWDRYDRLVRAAHTLHIGVYFDVTGPGPAWGQTKPPRSQARNHRTWMPKAREFYKFVKAVGKRYSGTYRDENDGRPVLPRVTFWSLWNEPNQGGWLTPQWWHGKPYSPAMYRKLFSYGVRGLIASGHVPGKNGEVVLAGETAPIGSDARNARSPMRPKLFIRELLCAPGTSGVGCSDFKKFGPLAATGWAHHPYTKKVGPTTRDPNPDSITMANIGELPQLLDELANTTHDIAPGLPIFSTEFGYETNPPDPYNGIPLEQQAQWLTLGDYLAAQQPRVAANTQFLLNDVAPLRKHKKNTKAYWFTYQSGLFGRSGQPKPSAFAYTFPFLAFFANQSDPSNGEPLAHFWGMLRFRPNYLAAFQVFDTVHLQESTDNGKTWTELGTATVTSNHGLFEGDVPVPKSGLLRGVWSSGGDNPTYVTSRPWAVTVPDWTPPPPAPAPPPPPPA